LTVSTIERAFALARTGKYATMAQLHQQLKQDGCRAVESLLSTRSIKSHLEAICAAASKAMPVEGAE
jgi:hypothetical protein